MLKFEPTPEQPLWIGLSGPAGSGKSTIGEALRETLSMHSHGGSWRIAFADPMKAMLYAIGVQEDVLYGTQGQKEQPREELSGRSVRHALQTLGTEWGRQVMHPDFWINSWKHSVKSCPIVICDDVRFDNELACIEENGFVVGLQNRGGIRGNHVSEVGVDATYVIDNGPGVTVNDVVAKIIELANQHREVNEIFSFSDAETPAVT
ncbi:hypothetical protein LOC67_23505 [Stieleria sp. JC731]|uniref:hypothetical protein n=1 Tax=Pirellulaceae TaxID=2691357 RepID=UPI001E2D6280|nr:hypothetical protein [Stieleria sp. JC731]MCC9603527.1 hypothetical protein [Stieleria sp. JC731]